MENKRKTISIMLITIILLQLILPIVPSYAQIYSDKYTIENGYIKAVQPGTTVRYLRNNLQTEQEIVVKKDDIEQSETAILATGMKAYIGNDTYTIIVKGDVNSDGKVSTTDLSQIRKHLSYIQELEGDERYAVDINLDGKISATDLSQMRKLLAYKLDVTPPSKTQVELVDYEQGNWTNKTVTQIFSATDDESGIGRYETYRFDVQNSIWTEEPNPSDIVEEGIYVKRARAKDKEGNVGEASEEYIVKIDKTAPEIINIETISKTSKIEINVEGQDQLSGIRGYRYSIDDGITWSQEETTGNYTYENLIQNTQYKIKVKIIDQAGNEKISETQELTTTKIPGGSDIQFSQTPEGETKGEVTVTVIWPELEQGDKKKISVDGVTWEDYTGPITVDENKTIYVKVETEDGQQGDVAEYEITNIDNEQIELTITGPDKEYIRQGEIATYTITSNKEISIKDIEKIKVEGCTVDVTGSGNTYTVKVTGGTQTKEVELVIEQGAFEDSVGHKNAETGKQGLAVINEEFRLLGEEIVYAVKGKEYIDAGYELTNGGGIIEVEVIPANLDTTTTEDKQITYNVKYKNYILQTKTRTVKMLIPPERIEIQGEEYVKVGGQTTYSINYIPETADAHRNITWLSQNGDIATIDDSGNIRGINVGETIITAITENGKEAIKRITVTDLTGGQTYYLKPGETKELTPTSYNAGEISWTTTSEQNASLSNTTGDTVTVTAGETLGTYAVTATGANGGPSTTYTIKVVAFDITPMKIVLDLNGVNTEQIFVIGDSNDEIKYESENEQIAIVNNQGLVTGLQNGETIITVTDVTINETKECLVTVVTSPTSIQIQGDDYVKVGGDVNYTLEYTPITSNVNTNIIWTSENGGIATVDQSGNVRGISIGETTIRAVTDNGIEATKKITVTDLTGGETYYLKPGDKVELTPISHNAGEISWTTTSEQNASLSNTTGDTVTVTAGEAPGTCVVTATGENGGPTTVYTIIILSFDITPKEITLDINGTNTEQISVIGQNYGQIKYESQNQSVAIVTNQGLVTAIGNGETKIIVTDLLSGTIKESIVKVQTSPIAITIQGEEYVRVGGETPYTVEYIPDTTNINNNIIWTSQNGNTAIIDQSGNVRGISVGETTIRAVTENGKEATKRIIVTDLTGGTTHYLKPGDKVELTPINQNAGQISWSTTSQVNAQLSNIEGNSVTVTAGEMPGTYAVTATGENGGPSTTYTIVILTFDIAPKEVTLDINGTNTAQISVIGENYGEIKYESQNQSVATVTNQGLVTATGNGETKIIVTDLLSGTIKECIVKVQTSPTSITIQGEEYVKVGGQTTFTVNYIPDTTNTNKNIIWTSQNGGIATVDQSGNVRGIGVGETTIRAVTENGVEATKKITVTDLTGGTTYYLQPGETKELVPISYNAGQISWSTTSQANAQLSNTEGNSVTVTGGPIPGNYAVTATGANGGPSTIYTIVILTFDIAPKEITLDLNGTNTEQISVIGQNYGQIKYESQNQAVAIVNNQGLVTATGNGETRIIVTELTTSKTQECIVKVQTSPSQIQIQGEGYVKVGGQTTFTIEYVPNTSNTNDNIIWTSQNGGIATVDQSGNVRGISVGETTIRAVTDNGIEATKKITVTDLTGGTTHYLKSGAQVTLTPTSYNAGQITWTTTNNLSAQLSNTTGNSITVTGGSTGSNTVTATGTNGGPSTTYTIIVDASVPRNSSARVTSGNLGDNSWYTNNVSVEITPGSDAGGSGVGGVAYRINGGSWQTSPGTNAVTVLITQEGTNTIEHYTYDNAQNQSSISTFTVKKDSVAPLSFTPTTSNITSGGFTINANTTDATSGLYTYNYYINNVLVANTASTSYTATGYASATTYSVKVVAIDYAGNKTERSISVTTKSLPTGTITFGETQWSSGKASVSISTSSSYTIVYQINSTTGTWTSITNGTSVTNLNHGDIVYARLYDGVNYGQNISNKSIQDTVLPSANITLSKTEVNSIKQTYASIELIDNESGINVSSCKWVYTTVDTSLGTNPSSYTGGTASSQNFGVYMGQQVPGTYYLHVLVVDNVGNVQEIISDPMVEDDAVARIDNTYYQTLQSAFDAVPNNSNTTVYLVKDIDQMSSATVAQNKTITLQLNGKNITNQEGTIYVYGNLYIYGTGNIMLNTEEAFHVRSTGNLYLSNGYYYATTTRIIYNEGTVSITDSAYLVTEPGQNDNTICQTIYNTDNSEFIMTGGTIFNKSYNSGAVSGAGNISITGGIIQSYYIAVSSSRTKEIGGTAEISSITTDVATIAGTGELIITGGTIANKSDNGEVIWNGSKTTITGGTIQAASKYIIYNMSGEVSISGGLITNNTGKGILNSGGTVRLYGGEIKGKTDNVIENSGTLYIDGGNVEAYEGGVAIYNGENSTVTMTNGSILADENSTVIDNYGTVEITATNSQDVSLNGYGNYTVYNRSTGTFKMAGGLLANWKNDANGNDIGYAIYNLGTAELTPGGTALGVEGLTYGVTL